MLLSQQIKDHALRIGFDLCGIAACRTLAEHAPRLDRWVDAGRHGGMEYMVRNRERRVDPAALVDGARTVIVCAVSYNFGAHMSMVQAPRVASYALARDYHTIIKEMLGQLLEAMRAQQQGMNARCFVDTAPLLEKAWAVEAGLGWIGKNSLLITPRFGSFVLLGEIVVDMQCDSYDTPYADDGCGGCSRCIDACLTGALCEPRVLDARRCISRLTVERTGERVVEDQEKEQASASESTTTDLHGWIFGCDACQSACPRNVNAQQATFELLRPIISPASMTRRFWETLTPEEFDRILGQTPMKRSGLERLQDNCERAVKAGG